MTRICGIELKASEAILAVVEETTGVTELVKLGIKKISIDDDEKVQAVRSFHDAFINFISANNVDVIVIKKRSKKIQFAGGPVSFKLEGLIQLNNVADVKFVSGQAIAAAEKKHSFDSPSDLLAYQHQAFQAACLWIRQNSA